MTDDARERAGREVWAMRNALDAVFGDSGPVTLTEAQAVLGALQEPPGERTDPVQEIAVRLNRMGQSMMLSSRLNDGIAGHALIHAAVVLKSSPTFDDLRIHDPDPEPEYDADRIAILAKHLGEGS